MLGDEQDKADDTAAAGLNADGDDAVTNAAGKDDDSSEPVAGASMDSAAPVQGEPAVSDSESVPDTSELVDGADSGDRNPAAGESDGVVIPAADAGTVESKNSGDEVGGADPAADGTEPVAGETRVEPLSDNASGAGVKSSGDGDSDSTTGAEADAGRVLGARRDGTNTYGYNPGHWP